MGTLRELLVSVCLIASITTVLANGSSYTVSIPRVTISKNEENTPAANISEFATSIYTKIAQKSPSRNIIISPFSIETAMALLYVGSEKYTARELQKCLLFGHASRKTIGERFHKLLQPMTKSNSIVQIANAIYIDKLYKLRKKFSELAELEFYSLVSSINFAHSQKAANKINRWVANKTDNNIENLVSPSSFKSSPTGLVLVNAIYFKGNWRYPFTERTWKAKFKYGSCNKTSFEKVEMMHVKEYFSYGSVSSIQAKVLELPYKKSNYSLLVILPWKCGDIAKTESLLNKFDLSTIDKYMNGGSMKVHVALPKFTIDFSTSLTHPLEKMGCSDIFSRHAHFEPMIEREYSSSSSLSSQPLRVNSVIHKAFIKVYEKGSIAAAATAVSMYPMMALPAPPMPNLVFNANHPFLILVRDSNSILFTGRYMGQS